MSIFLAQAVRAGLSRPQQNHPAGLCELLAVPTELSGSACLRTDRATLVGSMRPSHCQQSAEGRIGPVFGPLRSSTNSDKLSDLAIYASAPSREAILPFKSLHAPQQP